MSLMSPNLPRRFRQSPKIEEQQSIEPSVPRGPQSLQYQISAANPRRTDVGKNLEQKDHRPGMDSSLEVVSYMTLEPYLNRHHN